MTIEELERRLAADEIEVLDVREADERDAGFIPGSCHLPYRNARQAAEHGLCGERPIVTICESGSRASIAASVLHAAGLDARPVLDGGIPAWRARGGETTTLPPLRRLTGDIPRRRLCHAAGGATGLCVQIEVWIP